MDPSLLKKRILSVHTHKGGVGKTFFCVNYGFYRAKCGDKVLILDMDPQMNTTYELLSALDWKNHLLLLKKAFTPKTKTSYLPPDIGLCLTYLERKFINNPVKVSGPKSTEEQKHDIELHLIKGSYENPSFLDLMSFLGKGDGLPYIVMLESFQKLAASFDIVLIDLNPSFSFTNRFMLSLSTQIVCPMIIDDFLLASPQLYHINIDDHNQKFPQHIIRNPSGFFINMGKISSRPKIGQVALTQDVDPFIYELKKEFLNEGMETKFLGVIPHYQSQYHLLQEVGHNLVTYKMSVSSVKDKKGRKIDIDKDKSDCIINIFLNLEEQWITQENGIDLKLLINELTKNESLIEDTEMNIN